MLINDKDLIFKSKSQNRFKFTSFKKLLIVPTYLHNKEKFVEISKKNPLVPGLAIAAKACHGLKKIKDYNLSWAKEVYPDEFQFERCV